MGKGTYFVEKVVHFHCRFCGKAWNIINADETQMLSCPFCKGRQYFEDVPLECGRGETADTLVSEASPCNGGGGSTPLDRTIIEQTKASLQAWIDKQGHERCWFYPEIFRQLCEIHGIHLTVDMQKPPRPQFREGCERYEKELYEQDDLLPTVPSVEENRNGKSGAN